MKKSHQRPVEGSKTNCVYNLFTTNGGVYERSEFANRAKEIVDYMHREKAYIDTEAYQLILYSLARELKEFR